MSKLKDAMPCRRISVIQSYASKPDFGDLDVLIEGGDGFDPYAAAESLGAVEIVRNGDVTSAGFAMDDGVFQVDLIKAPADGFYFAMHYFAFNDLGNLMGRVAHKAGFKLGHAGLIYVLRDEAHGSHVIAELLVTNRWAEAITFLGYDPGGYPIGMDSFETLQDVFEYAVSSPYTNKDIYLLENRNNKSRVRDRKRKTYMEFLDWLESKPAESIPRFDWTDKSLIRATFLNEALESFPAFEKAYYLALDAHRARQAFQAKFNGGLVAGIAGLSGRELGEAIRRIKSSFATDEDMVSWVMAADSATIAERINSFAQQKISLDMDQPS